MKEAHRRLVNYSRTAFWSRIIGNFFLICAGVTAVFVTPPSVVSFGITGVLGLVWVSMLLGGAFMSVIGMFTGHRFAQFLGPSLVIGSFILWAISLVTQEDASASSYTVAFVFLAFACMKVCLMFLFPTAGVKNAGV